MDPVAYVVAGTGAFTAVAGWYLSRRSVQAQVRQQQVADRIAVEKTRLEETQQALDAFDRVIDMQTAEIKRLDDKIRELERETPENRKRRQRMVGRDQAAATAVQDRPIQKGEEGDGRGATGA